MLKELKSYAVPVVFGSALIYVGVAWAQTVKIEEPHHMPAGALTNLATVNGTATNSSAAFNGVISGYHYVANTIDEGPFRVPAADERQMLGRHDNQVMPSINTTATNSSGPPWTAGSPWTTYSSS
jgi:hypothetical protein